MEINIDNLNPQQKKAVIHDQDPLLIIAGAGTGKTAVITQRMAYLIANKGCKPEEILALTFTDKAAGEMEERVDRLLPYGYVDLWISTFHAFAERILHDHALEIGLSNDFKLLNTTEQWLLVRKNLDKFNLDYYRPLGNPTKFIHALIRHFSRAKDENISPDDYLDYIKNLRKNLASGGVISEIINDENVKNLSEEDIDQIIDDEIKKQEEIADAYRTYQQLLLDNNALDFGDLINYCLKVFQKRKNILAKYQKQFKYILVDEFQDTNYAQYELLKLLAGKRGNITVVGDDDQSVYKFRGASISNIMQFKDDYPKTKEVFLNQNYRSCQNILDLAYGFIQKNNPYRLEIKLVDNKNKKLTKKLKANVSGKGKIKHLHGNKSTDEVKLVIEKIITLYNSKNSPLARGGDKEGGGVNWSDFAILVRANSSAGDFIYALNSAGIPYDFVASKGLYAKEVVLDILAYFSLLDDYHESTSMYRVLSFDFWGLSQSDIIDLNYWSRRKGISLYESMRQAGSFGNISNQVKEKINSILKLIENHTELVKENKSASEIIQAFINDSGYLKMLTREDTVENRNQLNYLNQFYKKVQNFEKDSGDKSVKNLLSLVELELESGEEGSLEKNLEDDGPDTVKVMTIHSSKGLEFKYVFIVGLVDQRFPTIARAEPIELPQKLIKEIIPEGDIHLQEERRLMYVAMTRAKQGLYLTSADDYGGARKKKLSRFLLELEENGLKLTKSIEKDSKSDIIDNKNKKVGVATTLEYKLPKKFSFSQLKAFENCPYQYRFAYILKIPGKGKSQFSFGKSIHSTLHKLFTIVKSRRIDKQGDLFGENAKKKSNPEITESELMNIYQESFIDDWYQTRKERDEYFDLGKKSLKEFYHKHKDNWPQANRLEFPFNLRVKDGESIYTIYGLIDRIDDCQDGIRIVDYKTGNAKDKLSSEDKEQLLIYQLASQEVMKENVKELSFYYVNENKEVNFVAKDKELEKIREKIINNINQIKKGEFSPKPGPLCKYCDFRNICEFRS